MTAMPSTERREPRSDTQTSRRRGRRPGPTRTREAILAAARRCFAEHGYQKATVRLIASEAAVDPSLVLQHFGSKEQLLSAALEVAIDPANVALVQLRRGPGDLARRMLRAYLTLWDTPVIGETLAAMLVNSSAHDEAFNAVRRFMWGYIVQPVIAEIRPDGRALRIALCATHLMGVTFARHVLKVQPFTGMAVDRLVELLAPTLERYLTADLPVGGLDDHTVETWEDFLERQRGEVAGPCGQPL